MQKDTNIKIEHGIPIPDRSKYPFKNMKVGDSFFIPEIKFFSGFSFYAKKCKAKYTQRREGNGLRIWRIK